VLVVYSKTYYFIDKGHTRGITYDALQIFGDDLRRQLKLKRRRPHMVFIPVKRDELIKGLLEGRGDIAAAGLTITPGRDKVIDFSDPIVTDVDEIVMTGPASTNVAQLEDLSGQEVYVRKSSSYWEHLEGLNARLAAAGKAPVRLKPAPEDLEDEDLLEMLNGGLVKLVVVDKPLAELWTKMLPRIKPRPDLAVNAGGSFGWMVRENNPKLKQAINAFIKRHPPQGAERAGIMSTYLKSTKFVKDATADAEMRKFEATVALFRRFSDTYDMDYLMMMAQGYQESGLDQNAKSPVGAIGIMQVMPATAKGLKVGDIHKIDATIHAGVKYMKFLRDDWFGDPDVDPVNRTLFAFAGYNAGPGRISSLRLLAAKRGYDPNVWFNNVEVVTAAKVGMETISYVGNIYKYYIAYKLVQEEVAERAKAKESAAKP
jgi:membrane-bound lytic murein transglycosylase MltF